MAEDAPVAAPPETAKTEQPPTDESADKAPENSSTTDDKPTESANVTDEKKSSPAAAEQTSASGDATEAKANASSEAAATAEPATEANGTPSSPKKTSKDRRRSSGVGEKKLNRKKSMTRVTQLHAKPGQYYLARLKTFAPWPAIICDEEILPSTLLDTRPVTAAQEDGSYRADYADDGKRAHERTFPVMFFDTNEFAWIINTNLTPLDVAECKNISEKNKSKGLIKAYAVAAEGHDLDHYKKVLAEHQNALDKEEAEEAEAEAKKEAEKEAKAKAKADKAAEKADKTADKNKKSKRKSKAAETDVEMEDVEEPKKAKTPARKRKNDADAETEKPAKTPKTATKIKLTTPKAAEESGKKTPASKAKKPARKGKAAASDDEEKASSKEPEKQPDPEELKKKKEKEILFLRHKLQKGFISRDQPPKEDEMATMGTYFEKLEKHSDLEVSIIRSTKINKVLKMIVKLNSIPRDEEFKFRERAINILSNWKNVLDSDGPVDGSKPTSNGTAKDDDAADTPKLETEEEKEPETKTTNDDTPMPDAKEENEDEDEDENEKSAPKDSADAAPAEEKPEENTEVEASA